MLQPSWIRPKAGWGAPTGLVSDSVSDPSPPECVFRRASPRCLSPARNASCGARLQEASDFAVLALSSRACSTIAGARAAGSAEVANSSGPSPLLPAGRIMQKLEFHAHSGAESEDASRDRPPCPLSGARLHRVRGAAAVVVHRREPGLEGSELARGTGLWPQPAKSPDRCLRPVWPLLGGRTIRSVWSRVRRPTRTPVAWLGGEPPGIGAHG